MKLSAVSAFLVMLAGLGPGLPALAQEGVTDTAVSFAQVATLEGPAAGSGVPINLGIRAAFEEANRAGGVNGRKLVLDVFNDDYEPERALEEVRGVIAGDAHIALIAPVGTPTAQATQPVAAEAGFLMIGPVTGADFLRAPELGNVVNVRPSHSQETERWIKHLVDDKGLTKIAILYQDDSFGRSGLAGVVAALERRGMVLAAEGFYTRNTVAVKSALIDIRKSGAEAVVMVGTRNPMAEFIRLSRQLKYTPVFMHMSNVGPDFLIADLGAESAGIISTQVVPFPSDTSVPLVAAYQAALAAVDPAASPGFLSLEGYITGRLAIAGLQAAGPAPTRAGFGAAMAGLGTVDLGGITLQFGPGDTQAMDDVFMTVITADGQVEPYGG
ncbi:MAG: ABC transporter substrate-binding protein [Pseudotabrizicola sp.]|uniref:ABC transporter substrate-binding protein n=1 Tax=Pseudotabrizicola sp. TaxID=2939647 RepID=UPI00271A7472|nr:ABC transporter substrate-binding protein [Pseudotabrizicola sp.]MDO9640890.1 ABC transporter substrate-binding protein [Pseudotabrizicola sp.]